MILKIQMAMQGEQFFLYLIPPFLGFCSRCTAGDFPPLAPLVSLHNVCFLTLVFSVSHLYFVILINVTTCKHADDVLPLQRIVVQLAEKQWRKL